MLERIFKNRQPTTDSPPPPEPPARGRSADTLQNLVAGMADRRDKMSYGRYVMPRAIDHIELEAMYRTNWLVRKIVDIPADDMTREWIEHETETPAEKLDPLRQLEKTLAVREKVRDLLVWGRLYGGAAMIINVVGQNPETPLVLESIRQDQKVLLHVFDRWRLGFDGEIASNLNSAAFGEPEFYTVAQTAQRVHRSRMIFARGAKLPFLTFIQNGYWHDSIVQALYDALSRYDTVTQGAASMFFEAVVDVLRIEGLGNMLGSDMGTEQVQKRFELAGTMKSFNRMLLLDAQDEYAQKTNTFSGVRDVIERFMLEISGAADIPATRLFGQSPAGMNSTGDSDIRNYYDRIKALQEAELRPGLELLYQVLYRVALGGYPDDLIINFEPLWQLTDAEQAALEKTRAERDAIYLNGAVLTEVQVLKQLQEKGTYNITDEDIHLAEELNEALKDESLNADPASPQAGEEPTAGAGKAQPPNGSAVS
ncbi:MAG: DUF1073 domain-containing protein [Betaproteobacteria bacterium]|nr:DUF1073 domain-containing protein [Betaproteobacteria bacterium]